MSQEQNYSHELVEQNVLERFNLIAGQKVQFEKVSAHAPSAVLVGAMSGGILNRGVSLGQPVTFRDNRAVLSAVERVWEDHGILYLQTSTSVYRLVQERAPKAGESFGFQDIDHVITDHGSIYRYLPNLTTQRFKTAENYLSEPNDALVYVPQLSEIKHTLSKQALKIIGETEPDYDRTILGYVHDPTKDIEIVDSEGKVLRDNKSIMGNGGHIYLAFGANGKVDFYIPVSHLPIIGYSSFDKEVDQGGSWKRRHFGNKVVSISLKSN